MAIQKKKRIFDKLLYDELIGWNKEIELKQTIYDTMNPKLQEQINQIINNGQENETIIKIKEYVNCNNTQKNAIMKLILSTKKIGLDISQYYPEEYKEYLKIRKEIIEKKRKESRLLEGRGKDESR